MIHTHLLNGSLHTSEANCEELCRQQRLMCAGYSWHTNPRQGMAECYLITRR